MSGEASATAPLGMDELSLAAETRSRNEQSLGQSTRPSLSISTCREGEETHHTMEGLQSFTGRCEGGIQHHKPFQNLSTGDIESWDNMHGNVVTDNCGGMREQMANAVCLVSEQSCLWGSEGVSVSCFLTQDTENRAGYHLHQKMNVICI